MKTFYAFCFLLLSLNIYASTDSSLFFLSRSGTGYDFYFHELNLFTQQDQQLSKTKVASTIVLNGASTIDTKQDVMFFSGYGQLIGVDLNTGNTKYNWHISDMSFMAYNCLDSSIYFLTRLADKKFRLAKVDAQTGFFQLITRTPVADHILLDGSVALNPAREEYYFQDIDGLVVVDINTGKVKTRHNIGGILKCMELNPVDNKLYGLYFDHGNKINKLVSFNPFTGKLKTISSSNIISNLDGLSLNALSAIDVKNQRYYFQSVQSFTRQIEEVNMVTGSHIRTLAIEDVNFMERRMACSYHATDPEDKEDDDILTFAYPNPVDHVLNLSFTDLKSEAIVEIYDIRGNKFHGEEARSSMQLHTTNFEPGTYFIILRNAKGDLLSRKRIMVR
ncbi:MAG: T9SS type A sorting domain-containing protein [Bacteroidia bacterium]